MKKSSKTDISNMFYSGKSYQPKYDPIKKQSVEDLKIIQESKKKYEAMMQEKELQQKLRAEQIHEQGGIKDKKLKQLQVYNHARRPDRRFARQNVLEEKNQTWDGLGRGPTMS